MWSHGRYLTSVSLVTKKLEYDVVGLDEEARVQRSVKNVGESKVCG